MPRIYSEPNEYNIQEFLAEGLSASVYRAIRRDPSTQMRLEVALKILKSNNLEDNFRKEFEQLSRLRSAYCVRVYGWERFQGSPALVLEYVDGLNLFELNLHAPLSFEALCEFTRQAGKGLRDLHGQGQVHGDLSLGNIMVNRSGQIKLMDFGALRWKNHQQVTPEFAAPEILAGDEPNFQSDLYSLGKLIETLSGDLTSKGRQALLSSLLHQNPAKRELPPLKSSHRGRKDLVRAVQRGLFLKRQRIQKTMKIPAARPPKWRFWFEGLRFSLIFLFFQCVGGVAASPEPSAVAYFSVYTSAWKKIWVGKRGPFFTPLVAKEWPPGEWVLSWESPQGLKQRTLTLKARNHIVLGDGFFSSADSRDRSRTD